MSTEAQSPTEDRTPEARTSDRYMRTEFLERLAHELRGPTGVTLGALDELELALGAEAERFRALLNMARRGARKVLRSAERLSRTAQVEAGHVAIVTAPNDLAALIRRTCADAEAVEGRRTISLTLHATDAPCLAMLDPSWAQVALFEVVTQALRTARKHVVVELERRGGDCILRVTDDGGTARSISSARFEPQADRRDSGLAMPLALDIARAHGGDLRVVGADSGGVTAELVFAAA